MSLPELRPNGTARFSVIIVNYNGGDMLLECVRSVRRAGLIPEKIIVIDNGSRDSSLRHLASAFAGCVTIPMGCNAGFARAVNRGLAEVTTEFALLLNNDARVSPSAFDAFATAFDAHPRAAFLGGRLFHEDGRLQNAVAAFPRVHAEFMPKALLRALWPKRYQGRPQGTVPLQVESVIGALFAVRMQAVRAFGLLDEDFFFFLEETEWCHRAATHGWEVWHVPAAEAVHAQGATARKYNALPRIEYHRSRLIYFRKTAPSLYALVLTLAFFKAGLTALGSCLAVALTLGLKPPLRIKASIQNRIFAWYLQGRPADVGLPDKCPWTQA